MTGSGVNLVMTVIGFAVSTMFIVFVCTRLICARIQLSASRRSFSPSAAAAIVGSGLSVLERGLHGLEPVVVANFPTEKYGDKLFSFEDTQCTVCLGEYQEKDFLRILPYCGHAFHVACIDAWLQQHSTCPVCRISLRGSPQRKHLMLPLYREPAQSPYTPETLDLGSYHYLSGGHGYLSRTVGSQSMESIQEDQFSMEPSETGDTASTLCTEASHTVKDACQQESGGKHMESPSNT